jgi:hypothetical protein
VTGKGLNNKDERSESNGWWRRALAIAAASLSLAGCGGGNAPPEATASAALPTAEGVYVVQDGKIGRLDDDPQKVLQTWNLRSNLSRDLQFMVYHSSVRGSGDPAAISLQRVARVRAEIGKSGKARKLSKAEWAVANLPDFEVPVRVIADRDNPQLLRIVPTQRLTPGLYALNYRRGGKAVGGRFGVEWAKSDKNQYAALNCVDRYAAEPASYRLCGAGGAQQTSALTGTATGGAPGLRVHGIKARQEIIGGKPALVLEGRVTNRSSSRQKVPMLVAVLTDKKGKEIKRWAFRPSAPQLSPGGSLRFRTAANSPPEETASATVLLAHDVRLDGKAMSSIEQTFLSDEQLPTP